MSVRVSLLGAVRLELRGETVALPGETATRVLALLALNNGKALRREEAALKLWPAGTEQANFAQALKALRDAIARAGGNPNELLPTTRGSRLVAGTVQLNADWVDALEFDRLIQGGSRADLETALLLYEGDLLAYVKDPYEELGRKRRRYRRLAEQARARLAETAWEERDHSTALIQAAACCELMPEDREAWKRLSLYVQEADDRSAAITIAERTLHEMEGRELPPEGVALGEDLSALKLGILDERGELPGGADADADAELPSAPVEPDFQPTGAERSGQRSRSLAAAPLLGLAAMGAAVVFALGGETDTESCEPAALTTASRADLQATQATEQELAKPAALPEVDVGEGPATLAVGSEGVWVGQRYGAALINPESMDQEGNMIQTPSGVYSLAVAQDRIWAALRNGQLISIDRSTRRLLGEPIRYGGPEDAGDVAIGAGSVWVNNFGTEQSEGSVTRIDPCSGDSERIVVGRRAATVKYGHGSVWVTDPKNGAVVRLDPETEEISATISGFTDPNDLLVTEDSVWVTEYAAKKLVQINPETNSITGSRVPIGSDPAGITAGGGSLWVPLYGSGHLTRVELSGRESTIRAARGGLSPTDAVVAFGRVWMANNGEDSVTPVGTAEPE